MKRSITHALGIQHPIIQAPMAGGATSPELVAAVSNTGALGSFAAGYLTPDAIDAQLTRISALTQRPILINFFVYDRGEVAIDPSQIKNMQRMLTPACEALSLDTSSLYQPGNEAIYQVKLESQVEVIKQYKDIIKAVSFTFGLPEKPILDDLKANGIVVITTANSVEEACLAELHGYDAVVLQGLEAGGHQGGFKQLSQPHQCPTTLELLGDAKDSVKIPLIAAGGIMEAADITEALALGADAVQMGTAFLSCPEAGIAACYKHRLLDATGDTTVLTRAFTGKYARGLRNKFTDLMHDHHPEGTYLPFPYQGMLTTSIRKIAASQQNPEMISLWAGQGVERSTGLPAAELIKQLITDQH